MTAQEIADRLTHDPDKALSKDRALKLQGLAARSKVEMADVLRLVPPTIRRKVKALLTP